MTRYFKNAFADSGDKTAVPDDATGTLVSYETGYTPEYELDPDTDPNGNFVGRQRFNQIVFDTTENLKQWQDFGYPEFVADDGTGSPLSYQIGRIVELSGTYYRANTDNTTTSPPSAEWDEISLSDLVTTESEDDNLIIDGDLQHWVNGTNLGINTSPEYKCTMHGAQADNITGASLAYQRASHTIGQTDVPGDPSFYSNTVVTTAGSLSWVQELHAIEDVRTQQGKQITFAFWVNTSVNSNVRLLIEQDFGAGGSSTVTAHDSNTATTAATWTEIRKVITMPSISGKTIGTRGSVRILIRFDSGIVDGTNFSISSKRALRGNRAVNYIRESFNKVNDTIHGLYQQSYPYAFPAGFVTDLGFCKIEDTAGAADFESITQNIAPMSETPTVTLYSPITGTAGQVRSLAGDQPGLVTSLSNTNFTIFNNGTQDGRLEAQWTCDARIPL